MPTLIPSAPPTQNGQPHILLVEDQERAAQGLQELLSLQGFRVTCAADGPTGLAAARQGPFDAVVLDVRLPGMDGFEVCRALRRDAATRQVPVVMLTGLGDTPSKLQGFDTGADDYLVKPVPARELGARLKKLIAARRETAAQIHHQRVLAIGAIAGAIGEELNGPLAAALRSLDQAMLRPGVSADARRDLALCRSHLWDIAATISQLVEGGGIDGAGTEADRMMPLAPEGHA